MSIRRKAELVDTSVLIDLLNIPNEAEEHERRKDELKGKKRSGIKLFLPMATVIESGQHIQRIPESLGRERRSCASRYEVFLRRTLDGEAPWSFSPLKWDENFMNALINPGEGPLSSLADALARRESEMGDLTILAELKQLRANTLHVDFQVWTRDAGLKAFSEIV